jgi:hypothetical protein
MKNKPYPALLRPSNLYNEIKKRVPKSRETIPLNYAALQVATLILSVHLKTILLISSEI